MIVFREISSNCLEIFHFAFEGKSEIESECNYHIMQP